jgi:hypothetical protein
MALASPAFADAPLAPLADCQRSDDGVTVTASVSGDLTTIQSIQSSAVLAIPGRQRFIYPSNDGRAVLAQPDEGNLTFSRDPDQVIVTL